jgi:hypothetical protein
LYGGKIRAALDRQHPRDLFDVKDLLANEGLSDDVWQGFIFSLVCGDRPINEIIAPNFQDQRATMQTQFAGMTSEPKFMRRPLPFKTAILRFIFSARRRR